MSATERHAVMNHEREQEQIDPGVEGSQAGGKYAGQAIDGGVCRVLAVAAWAGKTTALAKAGHYSPLVWRRSSLKPNA